MNAKIEQIKQERVTGEQPVFPKSESESNINSNTQRVEMAKKNPQGFSDEESEIPQGPTPQSFSAIQNDFVEDKGGIGAVSKSEWGSELDNKASGTYSVDITTISSN